MTSCGAFDHHAAWPGAVLHQRFQQYRLPLCAILDVRSNKNNAQIATGLFLDLSRIKAHFRYEAASHWLEWIEQNR
jgi:hypothetical protein